MKTLSQLYATGQYNIQPEEPRREPNWGRAGVAAAIGLVAVGVLSNMDDTQPTDRPDIEVTSEVPSAVPSESMVPTPETSPLPTDLPVFEE